MGLGRAEGFKLGKVYDLDIAGVTPLGQDAARVVLERVEADDEAEHGCLGCELEEGGNVGRLGEDDGKMGVIDDVG